MLLGGLVAVGLWVWLIGRHNPGIGLGAVRAAQRPGDHRDAEALDAEDLEQMLAAHNARRRARGERELTAADLEQRVVDDWPSSAAAGRRCRPTASSTSC